MTSLLTIQKLESLALARYDVQLCSLGDAVLPPFLGSALRGAFGHALKAIACSMPHGDCGRCLLVERCLYPRVFETSARRENGSLVNTALVQGRGVLLKKRQDAPRPFIFIPPTSGITNGFMRARDDFLRWRVRVKAGDSIVFHLSLFGDAIQELPYIIYAISIMAQHGFGAERAPFALDKIFAVDAQGKREIVYTDGRGRIRDHTNNHTTLARLVEVRLAQLAIERRARNSASAPEPGAAAASTKMSSEAITSRTGRQDDRSAIADGARARPLADSSIGDGQTTIDNEVTLRFITPTRLRIKGQVIENPSFAQIAGSLSLRLSMLAETFADAPLLYDHKSMIERARDVTTRKSSLRLMALNRYSNRRGGKLELDGFMGDVTFAGGAVQELLPLLVAGEFLHVGSGTAFGLGRYLIVS